MSTSSASAHLVTYSTAVIMYLAPILFVGMGNGPMKSIAQILNVRIGFIDIKGIFVICHRSTKSLTSVTLTNEVFAIFVDCRPP